MMQITRFTVPATRAYLLLASRSLASKALWLRPLHDARKILALLLIFAVGGLPVFGAPGSDGSWGQVISWRYSGGHPDVGFVPIHATLMPNGKLLLFNREHPRNSPTVGGYKSTEVRVWIPPPIGTPSSVGSLSGPKPTPGKPGYDNNLFCSGHALLPDGKVLLTGGHIDDEKGLPFTNIFTWNDYTQGPSGSFITSYLPPMNAGRWYPTNTALGNGDVLVIGGKMEDKQDNTNFQIWQTGSYNWAPLSPLDARKPYYPWMHLAKDGTILCSGANNYSDSLYLDGNGGNGDWVGFRMHAWPYFREYGSSVMYLPNQVLVMGGGGGGDPDNKITDTAERLDLDTGSDWELTPPMKHPRRYLNATILPDGQVLATGGTEGDQEPGANNGDCYKETDESKAVYNPEVWNPDDNSWTELFAGAAEARLYHSTALLLPDGRVFTGGGGQGGAWCGQGPDFINHPNAQLYSPPYLYNSSGSFAARPSISGSTPENINYGVELTINRADSLGGSIAKVTMVRLGSVTHAYDQNQRFNDLRIIRQTGSSVTVGTPPNNYEGSPESNECPPGWYMLFILKSNPSNGGRLVPSVAKMVRIS